MHGVGSAIAETAKPVRGRLRWHHRPLLRSILASLIAGYIRLVDRTGRWRLIIPTATADLIRGNKPFIVAFWHGRLLMMYPAWRRLLVELGDRRDRRLHVVSSTHGDGKLIQSAVGRFGLGVIWGSSTRGGVKALREAQYRLSAGDIVVITPDGPRGPRMRAHPGVAYLAASAGVPVVPITFATGHQRTFQSWDRFMLVRPFASGVLAFGEPLTADGRDTESQRTHIEERLIAFSTEVDRAQGLDPIEPDG